MLSHNHTNYIFFLRISGIILKFQEISQRDLEFGRR